MLQLTKRQTPSRMFPSPTFFPDAELNFAQSVLRNRDPSGIAALETTEGSLEHSKVTWKELTGQVEKLAAAMKSYGVNKGDRIAAVISTSRLAVALCLATLSIGAIWSSISPDFGSKAILDRITQIDPKLVFADTTVLYNGKVRDLSQTIVEWAPTVLRGTSLKKIVFSTRSSHLSEKISKSGELEDFYERGCGHELRYEPLPFSHPAFIFYSSGTVGFIGVTMNVCC